MGAEYVVGIDLGTTHCALATAGLERGQIRTLPIPQLVSVGELAHRELLPSFLYLPATGELSEPERTLSWGPSAHVTGEAARRLGEKSPMRFVASAKSWICHGGVNRRAPILPWAAPDTEPHVSPFEAQVHYLEHLRHAWELEHPGRPLSMQDVVVTVPASFDESARELTLEAAEVAGLGAVRLLEEPQAAFYDFIGSDPTERSAILRNKKLLLVIDVGGGTTDLTLLRVHEKTSGEPELERIAVGGHLLLGGDNMDAALARFALERAEIARELDPSEWSSLVQSARAAKEALLASDAPEEFTISFQQRGSRLIGGTRSIPLRRDEVRQLLLDGFFPKTGVADGVETVRRAGLTTLGLPYATEPAVPRHVNSFLRRHAEAAREAGARTPDGLPRPDAVLLNGGVFHAPAVASRLMEVMSGWFDAELTQLEHTSLDTSVARGAARAALARRGLGALIAGGTPRAYYVALEGAQGERRALCIAPKGMEDGATAEVHERLFELVVNRPVSFPLFAYVGDRTDPVGAIVDVDEELDPLPPLETVLRAERDATGRDHGVRVRVSAHMNDRGALELYLTSIELPPRRWRLDFTLTDSSAPANATRSNARNESDTPAAPLPPKMNEAKRAIDRALRKEGDAPKKLRRELETMLGARGAWPATACRALADQLLDLAEERKRSATHEQTWLRLLGWGLRPGVGAHGDEARIESLWNLYSDGLRYPSKSQWAEWWILWRRVAAGLSGARQRRILSDLSPWLNNQEPKPPGPHVHGLTEMLQLLGALERLMPEEKESAGALLLQRRSKLQSWIPLGRLGGRLMFYGPGERVAPVAAAERWLELLLELDFNEAEGASFAALLLSRRSGETKRDVSESLRARVAERLAEINAPSAWLDQLEHAGQLSAKDSTRALGDALPPGLRIA